MTAMTVYDGKKWKTMIKINRNGQEYEDLQVARALQHHGGSKLISNFKIFQATTPAPIRWVQSLSSTKYALSTSNLDFAAKEPTPIHCIVRRGQRGYAFQIVSTCSNKL